MQPPQPPQPPQPNGEHECVSQGRSPCYRVKWDLDRPERAQTGRERGAFANSACGQDKNSQFYSWRGRYAERKHYYYCCSDHQSRTWILACAHWTGWHSKLFFCRWPPSFGWSKTEAKCSLDYLAHWHQPRDFLLFKRLMSVQANNSRHHPKEEQGGQHIWCRTAPMVWGQTPSLLTRCQMTDKKIH